jgi:hypothetical protein
MLFLRLVILTDIYSLHAPVALIQTSFAFNLPRGYILTYILPFYFQYPEVSTRRSFSYSSPATFFKPVFEVSKQFILQSEAIPPPP